MLNKHSSVFSLRRNHLKQKVGYLSSFLLLIFSFLTLFPFVQKEPEAQATIDEQYGLSIATSGDVEVSTNNAVAVAKNTINVTSGSKAGYKLFISTDDGKMYLDNNKTSNSYVASTSASFTNPKSLLESAGSSWGFAIENHEGFSTDYSIANNNLKSQVCKVKFII